MAQFGTTTKTGVSPQERSAFKKGEAPMQASTIQQHASLRSLGRSVAIFIGTFALMLLAIAPSAEADVTTTTTRAQLNAGESLKAGESLQTADGRYQLDQQGDGNLVLYVRGGRALWNTGTNGNAGARTVMQTDGNLVVYAADNRPLWSSRTANSPGRKLLLQTDGNVVIYTTDDRPVWSTGTVNSNLVRGETLKAGETIYSPQGRYQLIQQGDGNLVLYVRGGRALWASNTAGNPGARAVMQTDGNLVVYAADNRPLWASQTAGTAGQRLSVQTDGNLVIYTADNRALWAIGSNSVLAAGETLQPGEWLLAGNGAYQISMQTDGNLVLYGPGRALWASGTNGNPGARAIMQTDGNLVVYTPANRPLWASGTANTAARRLVVQVDGNLVLYTPDNKPVWATNTAQGGGYTPQDDYPSYLKQAAQDSLVDPWGFYNRECTSFVAWRLNSLGIAFSNNMKGGHFGNASNWANNASSLGYGVDHTPTVGSVAWWSSGHVAIVFSVNSDGSANVEQYNWGYSGTYSQARVRADAYLHIGR
jgi:surface antigen